MLGLCFAVALCGRFVSWGRRSAQCGDELFETASRKYYPLRHWQWSGIPPLEGGFVVDVNPFFNDNTSEILLLIQSRGSRFEYALAFPHGKAVQAILANPMPPPAMVFPYDNGLAILANFFGPAKGVYLLPLPLKSGTTLELTPASSPQFAKVAMAFKSVGQEQTTRDQFCESRRNDFIAFYEKYGGSCNQGSRADSDVNGDFAYFWLGDPPTKR